MLYRQVTLHIVFLFRQKLKVLLVSDQFAHIQSRGVTDKPMTYVCYNFPSISPQYISEQLARSQLMSYVLAPS
jgi:hypothetical protein